MRNFLFLVFIVFASCKQKTPSLTAQQIIDKSIVANGADKISNSKIEFDFRDIKYKAIRENGNFRLFRSFRQNNEFIEDILSNDGFERLFNTHKVNVPDSMAVKYSNSVNSVHYFSVLPFGLNDSSVHEKLLDTVVLNGESYFKVEVRFSEDGGGEDFEDVFMYWIGKEDFKMDYLAYSYLTDGGGMRFRVATNERFVNGIRFVDYNNYKPKNASTKLENLDKAFENNKLEKLSEINLENVQVDVLN
jgi:hypothetical protein